jgi:hypothetical protein
MTHSIKGRAEGKSGFHAEGLHYTALRRKRISLEVCRLDGARRIMQPQR